MIEGILGVEEEHANDMHDLLVAHEGTPLPRGAAEGLRAAPIHSATNCSRHLPVDRRPDRPTDLVRYRNKPAHRQAAAG
jgi:hypothetical protein